MKLIRIQVLTIEEIKNDAMLRNLDKYLKSDMGRGVASGWVDDTR